MNEGAVNPGGFNGDALHRRCRHTLRELRAGEALVPTVDREGGLPRSGSGGRQLGMGVEGQSTVIMVSKLQEESAYHVGCNKENRCALPPDMHDRRIYVKVHYKNNCADRRVP